MLVGFVLLLISFSFLLYAFVLFIFVLCLICNVVNLSGLSILDYRFCFLWCLSIGRKKNILRGKYNVMVNILRYTNIMQTGDLLQINCFISFSECLPGFTLNGTKCEQCPEGRYGEKYSAKCNCDSNER